MFRHFELVAVLPMVRAGVIHLVLRFLHRAGGGVEGVAVALGLD